ncbi:FkbM family methyltransferase [Jeongeupia sp. USM3]|uniref:FkbM family methyltransferase n=1 Tax=Jeongeupia sp. USM3 TaxID=1906741 RepID=UPI00089DF1F9|nr:FkbM family methyltransferase [Jeongeupia sp. USM3]AOX99299.1 FkbM family methyltransferase [Jeongeupia sp. USM3]
MNKAEQLSAAFQKLAASESMRSSFVEMLLDFEQRNQLIDFDIREEITGPLVDALFVEGEPLVKALSGGLKFEFLYRSKIARDFVMADRPVPDHVWEPQTSKLLLHFAGRCRNIVIGGAYFGDQAVLLAKAVAAAGGVVHAFEPNDDQRRMLERNLQLNGLDNVRIRPEGLWSDSSTTLKLVGYDSFASTEVVDAGGFATVALRDYFGKDGGPDLIMLDIEGAELAALQGASPYLTLDAAHAPIIVFEVHRSYVDWDAGLANTEIVSLLSSNGYVVYALRDYNSNRDMSGEPIELIPVDSVYLDGPPHGFNMVAVKDASLLEGAGFSICRNVSPKLLRHRNPALHAPLRRG